MGTMEKTLSLELNGQLLRMNASTALPLLIQDKWASLRAADQNYRDLKTTQMALPQTVVKVQKRGKEKSTFSLSKTLLKFEEKSPSEWDKVVEYDMDEEDYAFLRLLNEKRGKGAGPIADATFELVMDRLEKECHFQAVKSGKGAFSAVDPDALCCVCQDGEGSNTNQIIFCDMCNIAVHQECYGVPYIPEGQWLCRRCQLSPSSPVPCALCPNTTGAFKQTSDGRWAHVLCAIWLNEVHFANTVFMEPIEGVEHSIKRRCRLKCIVCKAKVGACLQCSRKSCTRAFHVTCAQSSGLQMVTEVRGPDGPDGLQTVNRLVFCYLHSPGNAMPSRESMAWSDAKTMLAQRKRQMDEKMRKARKELAKKRNAPPLVSVPVIPRQCVSAIGKSAGTDAMRALVAYWTLKRQSRCGVPLLRRLQVCQNKRSTSRCRNDGSGAMSRSPEVQKLNELRTNLERLRILCEMLRKREKMKKDLLLVCEQLVDAASRPTAAIMHTLIEKLFNKDRSQIFHQPVSETVVPGYRAIIARPMDLCTMRKRLVAGKYRHISEIRDDFLLMINNCTTFNKDNAYFYKYGMRMRRIGLTLIKAAEREDNAVHCSQWLLEEACKVSLLTGDDVQAALGRAVASNTPRSPISAQGGDGDAPSTSKKRKKGDGNKTAGLVQTPITRFLTPKVRRSTAQSAFSAIRDPGNALSPMEATTDASSIESNGEEVNEIVPQRTTRRRKSWKKVETVELSRWLEHDDLVWVEMNDGRYAVGVVVDVTHRLFEQQIPMDAAMHARPADVSSYTLVKLFDPGRTWSWFPNASLSHFCEDDGHPGRSRLQSDPALRLAVQKANKYRKTILNA